MRLQPWADEAVAEAIGRRRRADPTLGSTGGPAGNARLTAWLGAVLLVLSIAELVTILNVEGLITWHVVIGVLLVPPALAKTASTGWRIVRYYTGAKPYRSAGPPPMVLRVLGPLVVLSTLAVLGTGLVLIAVGPVAGRTPFLNVLGFQVDTLTLHQGTFILWAVFTGVHLLGRAVPALGIIRTARVPGNLGRWSVFGLVAATAAVTAVLVLGAATPWVTDATQHVLGHHRHQ